MLPADGQGERYAPAVSPRTRACLPTGPGGQPVVSGNRRCNDHRVQVAANKLAEVDISLHRRILRRDPFEMLGPQVTSGGEVTSGVLAQNPGQVWAPISRADEPYPDHEFTSSAAVISALRAFDSTIASRNCERYWLRRISILGITQWPPMNPGVM